MEPLVGSAVPIPLTSTVLTVVIGRSRIIRPCLRLLGDAATLHLQAIRIYPCFIRGGVLMKSFQLSILLAVIAGFGVFGATASAEPLTVSTDRVSVHIGDNGSVQVRSRGNDLVNSALERRSLTNNLTNQRLTGTCQQVTQRSQSHTQIPRQGNASGAQSTANRIYTQSQSSTQVCN